MLRRLKEDVEGQLPKRMINNYFVKMEAEQRARYDEYNDLVAKLLHKAKHRPLSPDEMKKLQKFLSCMRIICDTPFILDPKCRIAPKIEELRAILADLLVDPTTKIIIFSEWERMLDLVKELADANHIEYAWHTGSVKQDKRRLDINRFKQDPNCRLFLSTDSGSVGLNLQAANVVINLDLPWNPAKLEQRIARAWRKHQTRPVQVVNLVSEDSIEHRMLHLLAQKQLLAKGVLEGTDDLKEMKLPSGRAAFIERMESLMGTATEQTPSETASPLAPEVPTPSTQMREELEQSGSRLDLLQRHRHPLTEDTTLLAVVDKDAATAKIQLQESLCKQANASTTQLEVLDRDTLLLLQRLAKAGIITFNKPDEILHASPAMGDSQKQIAEKHRLEAQRLLQLAAHKQRLASVLINSEFYAEVAAPLLIAMQHLVHAFAYLTNHGEELPEVILSARFIAAVLVAEHQLPKKSLLLWTRLNEKPVDLSAEDAIALLADSQELFKFVETSVTQ